MISQASETLMESIMHWPAPFLPTALSSSLLLSFLSSTLSSLDLIEMICVCMYTLVRVYVCSDFSLSPEPLIRFLFDYDVIYIRMG